MQNLGYSFDAATGNLSVRSDVLPGTDGAVSISEEFEYDHLNRLSGALLSPDVPADSTITPPPYDYGSIAAVYNPRGNVLNHTPLTMSYNSASDPYALSSAQLDDGSGTPGQYFPGRTVTMTSFDRPASVADTIEQTSFASYDYDASGRKARAAFPVIGIERVYLGDCFEMDGRTWETPSDSEPDIHYETVQRLFLGGTAYDAPMVLVKVDDGAWALYNIGRDVQGSITHVLESDGRLLERYVYDPWGNVVQLDSLGTVIDSLAAPTPIGGTGFCSRIVGSHGYTGHEYIVGASLLNANARLYDPFLGRFLSPDPLIQDPGFTQNFNRYAYCLNNPLKYTDEDGEFVFSLFLGPVGAVLDAACWGALISGASYTASVAMSDGGFSNWDSGAFWKSVGWGAVSGAATFGVGQAFSAAGNFAGSFGTELLRGLAHGAVNGSISALQGGSFWSGFASGAIGSYASSAYSALGLDAKLGDAGMLAFGAVSGGLSALATGGDFFRGAAIGLVTSGFNHLQHSTERYVFARKLFKQYTKGDGDDYILTEEEFQYLLRKGVINNPKPSSEEGFVDTLIDFYKSGNPDLILSFGIATVRGYYANGAVSYQGFHDYYDFNAGNRYLYAEILTRIGSHISGTPFNIYYNKGIY